MTTYEDFNAWPGFTLTGQLERIVALFPDRVAIIQGGKQLTYNEFDHETDRVKLNVLNKGAGNGQRIALFLEHGISQFVALFGVLKSGAAYVALDTTNPAERISYILGDAGVSLIITNNRNLAQAEALANDSIELINIDNLDPVHSELKSVIIAGDDICSIIYTSGSTGNPKGTWFSHKAMSHFAWRYSRYCGLNENDRVGYFVSISFSAHAMPMLGALMNGGALVLFDLKKKQLSHFRDWLVRQQISVALMIPSVLRNFSATLEKEHYFPHLRLVLSGGESLFRADVEKLFPHLHSDALIMHILASTEAYLTTALVINKHMLLASNHLPVGLDVEGMRTHVMDENENPVGFNTTGEIWIESDFLAGGYWNDESLTGKHFFDVYKGMAGRVFKSGDLGMRQPDGSLVISGRKDHMVKLRGYRIDVREIESVLLDLPEMLETAVLLKEDQQGGKHLVAFVVIRNGHAFDESRIKLAVLRMLPDYMVPGLVVRLGELPKAHTGKVDFQHIPDPDWNHLAKTMDVEAVITPTEIKLAEIVGRMLSVSPVGRNHNIIQLAKDSLKLFVTLDEIEKAFGKKLSIDAILAAPTIKSIAEWLDRNQ